MTKKKLVVLLPQFLAVGIIGVVTILILGLVIPPVYAFFIWYWGIT